MYLIINVSVMFNYDSIETLYTSIHKSNLIEVQKNNEDQ